MLPSLRPGCAGLGAAQLASSDAAAGTDGTSGVPAGAAELVIELSAGREEVAADRVAAGPDGDAGNAVLDWTGD